MKTKANALEMLLSELESYKTTFRDSSFNMMQAGNCALYTNDLILCAVANRAISLVDGFLVLAKNDNYLCALPLIRLQLDNSLRFFATSLVKNSNDFFTHFASGKPIKDYLSIDGKKLSDNYLVTQMEQRMQGVKKIYKETSNYIHLSDQHLWIINRCSDKSHNKTITVGPNSYFTDSEKIHFIKTMLDVSLIVNIIINDWSQIKTQKSSEIPIPQN